MSQTPQNKLSAQNRIDQIQLFRKELGDLENENILFLTPEQSLAVRNHHDELTSRYSKLFDTDSSDIERKFSTGMKVLTFLGGLALCASVFYFFYQVWGNIPTTGQVGILVASPLLSVWLIEYLSRKERTGYYATLAALLALTCFVLNLNVLGKIYNITPSQNAFLIWGVFAICIAYLYSLRLMLTLGLISLLCYLPATIIDLGPYFWINFYERPECFILTGLIFVAIPKLLPHSKLPEFSASYIVVGLLAVFLSTWILSISGRQSFFLFDHGAVELFYQAAGLVLSGICIWVGIRLQISHATNIGTTFFTIFLYTRLVDWWWDLMPRSLFFLVISLITIGLLVFANKLRTRQKRSV